MDSRQNAGAESVRLPGPSRRAVITGALAATLANGNPSAASALPDDTTRRCRRWLALTAQIERLQDRWARLENRLVKQHGWLQLSPGEQQALPWVKELRDIDGCLDLLFRQRDALLQTLPASRGVNAASIIARLAVVERLIWPDDHPEAHALVVGARQDLIVMTRRAA